MNSKKGMSGLPDRNNLERAGTTVTIDFDFLLESNINASLQPTFVAYDWESTLYSKDCRRRTCFVALPSSSIYSYRLVLTNLNINSNSVGEKTEKKINLSFWCACDPRDVFPPPPQIYSFISVTQLDMAIVKRQQKLLPFPSLTSSFAHYPFIGFFQEELCTGEQSLFPFIRMSHSKTESEPTVKVTKVPSDTQGEVWALQQLTYGHTEGCLLDNSIKTCRKNGILWINRTTKVYLCGTTTYKSVIEDKIIILY